MTLNSTPLCLLPLTIFIPKQRFFSNVIPLNDNPFDPPLLCHLRRQLGLPLPNLFLCLLY